MSQVNGTIPHILSPTPPLDESRQSCVDLLADALEEAAKGKIKSVAIVVCVDEGIATVMAGKDGAALNIGCDDLKKKIHYEMFERGNVERKKSAIVRAR